MSRSFLNIVTVDGRLCRVAEFGFHADMPSFDGDFVVFRKGESYKKISLETGMITSASKPAPSPTRTSPSGRFTVECDIELSDKNGFGYVHLILTDNEKSTETVLTRFMGSENSLGVMPFSDDSVSIVFFGYPEDELG